MASHIVAKSHRDMSRRSGQERYTEVSDARVCDGETLITPPAHEANGDRGQSEADVGK